MATDKIRLVNEHGAVIGGSEIDLDSLSYPDVETFTSALQKSLSPGDTNAQKCLEALTSESTDAEINDALDEAGLDEKMLSALRAALTEHLVKELHEKLLPLTEDIATEIVDDPEVKIFLQGLLAGTRPSMILQIRAKLSEGK